MIPDAWDLESREGAQRLARYLLETGSVRFDPRTPFRHKSGMVSPVHFEGRRLLSYPAIRRDVTELAVRMIRYEIGRGIEVIAAAEGAGVPFATLIADRLGLPLVFVRKGAPEDCPQKARIEGELPQGARVLLVEQIATDGHRKIRFVEPLREAGCDLRDIFVLFQYGIFDSLQENLAPQGITLHALATWWDLLEVARRGDYLDERALREIQAYLNHPQRWCETHQGKAQAA